MNIWKLTAGIAPALGLFASMASAQLCPSGNCATPQGCGPNSQVYTTTVGAPSYTANFGPTQAPFNPTQMSVDQFNPAAIAALPQHAGVNVADISLLKAEVRLSGTLDGQVLFDNLNTNLGCQVNWEFTVDALLAANATVMTDPLPLQISSGGIAPLSIADVNSCPAQANYEFQGTIGPDADDGCFCTTTDLDPWTGAGQLSWDLSAQADDNDTSLCGAICKIYNNQVSFKLEVVYTYCIAEEPPPPVIGCACQEPSPHYRRPGSLLLFPEFDNRTGDMTLITVTNTDCTANGDVDVEFVFIDERDCSEFNTTISLTPCDTFTAITNALNPNMEQGYFYAFAKNAAGDPITHNGLIGSAMVISGLEQFDYQVNPVAFLGMTAAGSNTDLDDDGVRDLDGLEYDHAPDTITVPRFIGQGVDSLGDGTPVNSHLILIGLSGGQDFTTTICFNVYNDNEEGFSGEHSFDCWDKPTLLEVEGSFSNFFLKEFTDHDPQEILGAANRRESGWICIDGCVAVSQQETIQDPAFYAVLVERVGSYMAADLPFECGRQTNGALLPRGLFGDGDPIPMNNDNK